MVSEARLQANRRNATKSTGPRTAAGKGKSAMNAVKHGIWSRTVLLDCDDRDEFETFAAGLVQRLQPADELERMLVDRIVTTAWRLRRLQQIENAILEQGKRDGERVLSDGDDAALGYAYGRGRERFEAITRAETALERSLYRALEALQEAQSTRPVETMFTLPALCGATGGDTE